MSKAPLDQAIQLLQNNDVVAIPTETVYGLAAAINSPAGIAKIFALKKRPFFDPLIVHVSSKKMAEALTTDWNSLADYLADHFWPGPLTMILPKSESVSSMITSGLQSVGLRMPKHPMALELIDKLGVALAAPSANLFGKTSPTSAEHVRSEFIHENLLVLDGGACAVGVESTVLLIQRQGEKYQLSVLRAGDVTQTALEISLKAGGFNFEFNPVADKRQSPGQMKHHYMPDIPLVLTEADLLSEIEIMRLAEEQIRQLPDQIEGVSIKKVKSVQKAKELLLPRDARLAARNLYSELRKSAESEADLLYFRLRPEHKDESWQAIMDRLTKAASIHLK